MTQCVNTPVPVTQRVNAPVPVTRTRRHRRKEAACPADGGQAAYIGGPRGRGKGIPGRSKRRAWLRNSGRNGVASSPPSSRTGCPPEETATRSPLRLWRFARARTWALTGAGILEAHAEDSHRYSADKEIG